MVKKILISVILFFLLAVPFVFAVEININTLPEYRISVIVREAEKLITSESFHRDTGTGKIVILTEKDYNYMDLILTLKKDARNILVSSDLDEADLFKGVSGDEPIFIDFSPGDVSVITGIQEPEVNESEEIINESEEEVNLAPEDSESIEIETDVVSEETEATKSTPITGSVISGAKLVVKSKITYIIIVGLVVVFVLLLIVKNKFKSEGNLPRKTDNFRVVSLEEKRIEEAERKLAEAKQELDEIKNRKGKIKEAEERIRRDREELERLKNGEI